MISRYVKHQELPPMILKLLLVVLLVLRTMEKRPSLMIISRIHFAREGKLGMRHGQAITCNTLVLLVGQLNF